MRAAAASRWAALCCLALVLCAPPGEARAAEPPAPLVLERTIPLPDVSGRIDHLAVDLRRGRLFVAELGNGSVDAIDLASGRIVRRIQGLREPQGIGYAPRADLVAVASAGDGSVRLFRGEDLAPAGQIDLGDDADNVRLDPSTGRFVVGYGSGSLAVLDPESRSVVSKVALPAHPEGFQLDPGSGLAYVNLPDAGGQIEVVEPASGKQVTSWRLPDGSLHGNFPMALDAATAVLATVFRNPPRLVLLDMRSGDVAATLPTCGDADDVFLDAGRRRLMISCGEGAVDVVQRTEQAGASSAYHPLARVPTRRGARTSLFVPQMNRLYVAAPRTGPLGTGADAAILVFRPAS